MVRVFLCIPTLCVRAERVLLKLCVCAGSSETSLLANAIRTNIK